MTITGLTEKEVGTIRNMIESLKLDCVLREQAEDNGYMKAVHAWNERYYTDLLHKVSAAYDETVEAVNDAIDETRGVKQV